MGDGSEEEMIGAGEEGHDAKRSKMINDDGDRGPLDTIGRTPCSAVGTCVVRSHVRFATDAIEPMSPLTVPSRTPTQSANYPPPSVPGDYKNTSTTYNNTQAPVSANHNNIPYLTDIYNNVSGPSVSYDGMPTPPTSYPSYLLTLPPEWSGTML